MFKHKIYLIILTLAILASCKKEDDLGDVSQIPGLGGDTWAGGTIDTWIRDTLTVPFNVSAKYKWDQGELEFDKTLTPPKEEKIIPVLSSIKKVWIDNYVKEAGKTFMMKYIPKYFVLVGSASWNTDGTITLGTAEGGRRIILYVLNDFRVKGMTGFVPGDSVNIKEMFHTIEHEFGHILHQNVMYPEAWKRISVGDYTSSWNLTTDSSARAKGFITMYAQSNPDDDFVEMISMMLTEGKGGYEAILSDITNPTGLSKLRQKETMVVSYFKDVWGINFASLQARTRNSIDQLIK
ncbi:MULTISPECIES: zinc-binding metallopeptidase [Niastella]|uniref:Zinc-binding metallopeptidase n=1 Tax=Niastella soli TaxID=2821487 RepID=A0ABS3YTK7_9BACT|nr:putative zinc-binding metallopeptidase [Niastella soli]MBO9201217.1 putative zinc-binding metallopeptidase [Niastella soli]